MRYGSPQNGGIIGDEVVYDKNAQLDIRLPQTATVRIFRDGKQIIEKNTASFAQSLPGKGIYRAEIYKDGTLWILTSPIYIN
ncbi:hypothetical protein [Candidatus Uabimicrobium amorphum]|uniref:Uncharacterized protein n=1 Tax=Uabimicrobium amorphum TaxID=2596890 RepID=A0A5S9IK09_UABAM|nr:hypothetical protein [Candidatus Uabimicrobium amorphum]BBM83278.1 hypothetical protein UABAM_01629 [Candidatus Uabimicrobium amorphum]